MISRSQQVLLKRAQREAGLDDPEYRDAIELVSLPGCRSSKDGRLTDEHVDTLLSCFEAIHWRKVDSGELQPSCKLDAVFRQRRFWAQKNTHAVNSRDRFIAASLRGSIDDLEARMAALGFGPQYCAAIRQNVLGGHRGAGGEHLYRAALERTLRSKEKKLAAADPAAGTIRK